MAKNPQNLNPTKRIKSLREEPTWGDQTKILDSINALRPKNCSSLISAFGLSLRGPKDLQIIRNACAHLNGDSLALVRQIRIYYLSPFLNHPSDLAWQQENKRRQTAFYLWLEDLKLIAEQATK